MKRTITGISVALSWGALASLISLLLIARAPALDAADQSGRGRFALTSAINHLGGGSGPPPIANACTGFALLAGGGDLGGKVTFTSATTCTMTFGTAFQNAPACTVTPGSAASTTLATTTTTGLSITFGTANTAFAFTCIGL